MTRFSILLSFIKCFLMMLYCCCEMKTVNAWIVARKVGSTGAGGGGGYPLNSNTRHTASSLVLSALTAPSYDSSSSSHSNNDTNESNNMDWTRISSPSSPTTATTTLGGGRILEGGKVIDFSSVKASSKAETALAEARQLVLQQQQKQKLTQTIDTSNQPQLYFANEGTQQLQHQNFGDAILGINQDVIDQVGHELGTFCSAQEVQECAAYLRSQAPSGLFSSLDASTHSDRQQLHDASKIARYEAIIAQAYVEAGEVTSAFAKTFYMGTMLMSENARRAIWAVYVWCRRTDEIVDAPRDNNDDMLYDLSLWEMRLEQLWQSGQVVDVYDLCLLHTRIQYPTMDIQPFLDMIRGMLMDVPDLGTERYENFDELHLYCYRVAGTVGVMSLPVFGCAPGYNEDVAREPALSLGVAFQLTNILRDVGEDAKQRGRIYLPREDLRQFSVTEEQIFAQHVDDNYRNMMKFQIARARMYYERARRGVFMLAEESRLPVQTSLDAYGRILDKIEENEYDSLTKRAYVDKWEKLSIIPFSWYRTTDVSRTFPLPGDKPVDLTLA